MNHIIKGTSCYANAKSGNLVSITGDGGNAWGFYGPAYKKLAPNIKLVMVIGKRFYGPAYKKLAPSLKLYEYWRDNPDNFRY